MAATQSSDLIDALNKAASNPPKDAAERRNLYKAARRLMLNVETSHETTQRVYYGGLPLVLAGIAIDLGLFKLLSNNPDTQYSLENLAKTVGTHELLLREDPKADGCQPRLIVNSPSTARARLA